MEKENKMIDQLLTRIQNGETVNISFWKKDGQLGQAAVCQNDFTAKTDRKKVDVAEGTTRLFCENRGRYITVQNDTIMIHELEAY